MNLNFRAKAEEDTLAKGQVKRSMSVTPSVCSDWTELSVHCGNLDDAIHEHDYSREYSDHCGHHGSMQETTVGPDTSYHEFSREEPSTEYHSMSRDLNLNAGPSVFS